MPKRTATRDVWLYGKRLATVAHPHLGRVHYRLDFTEEALDSYGEGTAVKVDPHGLGHHACMSTS
jgi:hypothetical protein